MFEDLAHDLVRLGFSEKEAAVYVALLRVGNAAAPEVAERAGISRSSTHDVLEHLGRMGLVTAYVEKEQHRFSAEPPERLINVLHLQRRELETREQLAQRLLPRLAAVHTSHAAKPKIRYIEGIDGLRNMQREYECYEGDIMQLVGYDAFMALEDRQMSREHQQALTGQQRKVQAIHVTDRRPEFPHLPGVEVRYISPALLDVKGEVDVCGDRVLLFSYVSGIIAIEILSPSIANTVRAALELAWRGAEKFDSST